MKRFLVTTTAIAIFSLPATAWAVQKSMFTGTRADAIYQNFDGCIYTFVYILARDDHGLGAGPPSTPIPSILEAEIVQIDYCGGGLLVWAFGWGVPIAEGDFSVDPGNTSASLNTTVNLINSISGGELEFAINLNWTATGGGPPVLGSWQNRYRDANGCTFIDRGRGKLVPAVASGTVVQGTANYTPEPTPAAEIAWDTISQLWDICH